MPSVFTIQGPELFPRARKRTKGSLGQAAEGHCVWVKDARGPWKKTSCTKDKRVALEKAKKARRKGKKARVLPKGKKPRTRKRR